MGRETPPIELPRDAKPLVGISKGGHPASRTVEFCAKDCAAFARGTDSRFFKHGCVAMMNSLVVSLALALGGDVQPGLSDMPGAPNYAPVTASPMMASFGTFSTFQPTAPPPVQNGAPAPPAAPPAPGPAPSTAAQATPTPPPPDPNSVRPDWLKTGTCAGCWLDDD